MSVYRYEDVIFEYLKVLETGLHSIFRWRNSGNTRIPQLRTRMEPVCFEQNLDIDFL